jgi:hypothetical protein
VWYSADQPKQASDSGCQSVISASHEKHPGVWIFE